MKRQFLSLLFILVGVHLVYAQRADAGPDKVICKAKANGVTIGNMTEEAGACYIWKADPEDPSIENAKTAKIKVNPTQTTTYTLTVIGPSFSYFSRDQVKVFVIKATLRSLEFTSDHNKMCDGSDLLTAGNRYPDVEWSKDDNGNVTTNAPITHTAGDKDENKTSVELKLDIEGLNQSVPYTIIGESNEDALKFKKNGTTSGGRETIDITATNPIGKQIRKINKPINWSVAFLDNELSENSCDLGPTQNIVFTTIGTPNVSDNASTPNIPRMERSVNVMDHAIKEAGGYNIKFCYPTIVWKISSDYLNIPIPHSNFPYLYYGARELFPNNAWNLYEVSAFQYFTDNDPNLGADCITISRYVSNICNVMGIPGEFDSYKYIAYYRNYATDLRPTIAERGNFHITQITPISYLTNPILGAPYTTGLGQDWLLLFDDGPHPPPNGPPGINFFEGAVEYKTDGGDTYYFPGGTPFIYNNKDKVLPAVFRALVWCEKIGDNYIIRKDDYVYPGAPPNDVPNCN